MRCSKCGHETRETAKFCDECGAELKPTPSWSESKSELIKPKGVFGAERKNVTALFSDLSGYTAMTEKLDPEEVKEITGLVFDGIRTIVGKYEGFVDRFAGDGALVLFGVPRSHEDDPLRAIRAALEIHEFVEASSPRFESKVGGALSMHSGINTGLAVTADVDPEKGSQRVTGDAINVASRLSDLAGSREILVGLDTYKATQGHFLFESLKPVRIKGKTELVPIYKVISKKDTGTYVRAGRQIFSEMIGRDRELDRLELQVLKAVQGEGSVVNVIGEAGIGKSRLIAELKRREVMKPVALLEGRAISIGKNLSFHPIIDLLKQWAGIAEDDSEAKAFDKLAKAVRAVHPEEAEEILPFLATLMGMKLMGKQAERVKGIEGEALENLVFKNFRELLIQAAKNAPLVVIIEDFHWADLSSIGFLESVFRLAGSQRILFINAIRPGYAETGERTIRTLSDDIKTNYVEIRLEHLDVRSSETMINNMLKIKGLPIPVIRQIVSRSDGNPYFIEEVVRSFIDQGVVVEKEGAFEVDDTIDKVVIPHTINDLLTARIDRLEEKNRELIKTASVIGRNFFYRILKGVAESIEDIDLRLSYLKNIQLILERQRLDEIEYLFTHALAQEAAYASILLEKRKGLHFKVAQAIEKVFSGNLRDFYGVLSYHYFHGEDFPKAEEYLIKSGEEALNSSASSEAITYFKEALRLYQDRLGKTADRHKVIYLEKCIALAYYNKGQLGESIKYFDKILPYYGIKTSKNPIFSSLQALFCFISFVASLYFPSLRRNKRASLKEVETFELWFRRISAYSISNKIMFLKDGLRLFSRLSNYNLKTVENGVRYLVGATALFSYGGISFALGEKVLNRVKNDVEKNDPRDTLYYIMFSMLHEFFSGNISKDIAYDEKLVADNLKLGDVLFTSYYPIHHIFRKIEKGSFKEAIYVIQKLSELIEAYRCDYAKSNLFYVTARLLLKTRKLHDALNAAEEGIVYESKAGDVLVLCQIYSIKTRMLLLTGDLNGAEHSLENAEKVGTGIMPPLYSSEIYLSRFVLQLSKFEALPKGTGKDQLAEYSRKALKAGKKAIRATKKAVYNSVEAFRYMGIYYWITNKQKKALKYWGKSIIIGENAGTKPELARTYFEVGQRLSEKTSGHQALNGLKAEDYLEKAKVLFQDLDLKWDLEKLTQFMSSSQSS